MNRGVYIDGVINHYRRYWGENFQPRQWAMGPTHKHPPNLRVLEFAPHGDRTMWSYATAGMSCEKHGQALELHMFSGYQTERIVELLAIVASYHFNNAELGLHHRINFGGPWLENSKCTRGFISLPYLDGPDLEFLCLGGSHVRFLWLIPITESEAELVDTDGVEELESRFERRSFDYLDPNRAGVA